LHTVDGAVAEESKRRFVDWRFSTEDARIKLKRLYPSLQE
jgi:hypothetical protein